ncbi:MAG: acyltransferase family protein [Pseudomonadota bacterium]
MTSTIQYRRDIDGLRAIAVLPVLLFHIGNPYFQGGYVGVDIFFVISGFLITGIIAREMDAGRFSIVHFYERRARRIMPALIAVILATLVAASIVFLPNEFDRVADSALLATLFVSNVGFFLENGYFSESAKTAPLLHTWSLAVEEQFYLGFPILLLLIARFAPKSRALIIGAIAAISFILAFVTQANRDEFAFYLLPPRAWELFVGALLALGVIPQIRSRIVREVLSVAGFAAILWAVLTFDERTVFPGVNALFPVLGTAALIHCAPGTLSGKFLSFRLFVAIGLISYSLYLWHWPIIVFTEYAIDAPLGAVDGFAVLAASFVLAIFSWAVIERPFRQPNRISRKAIFATTGMAMGLTCAVAGIVMAGNGWPNRFNAEVVRLANATSDISPVREACITNVVEMDRGDCVLGAGTLPSVLLWGDSHGVEVAWALGEQFEQSGRSLAQRTRGNCPPILDYYGPVTDSGCRVFNRNVLSMIESDEGIGTIVLSGFWMSEAYASPENGRKLNDTIERLIAADRNVVLIGAVPDQRFEVPRRLAHLARNGGLEDAAGVRVEEVRRRTAWLRPYYAHWRALGVTIIEPSDTLCRSGTCAIIDGGQPLYFDSHHVSLAGARLLIASNRQVFQ